MDMHFEGVVFQTHAAELRRRIGRRHPPLLVIDVRPAGRYASGHVPGACSLTLEELRRALPDGATAATELVVVGEDHEDPMVRTAALALRRHGVRRIVELSGGFHEWERTRQPVEVGPARAAA